MRLPNLWKFDDRTVENVVKLLRESVVGMVEGLLKDETAVVLPGAEDGTKESEKLHRLVCVLSVGEARSLEKDDYVDLERKTGIANIPGLRIYDLSTLLDEHGVRQVVQAGRLELKGSAGWVMVLKSYQAVELQLTLLRLEAYLRTASY